MPSLLDRFLMLLVGLTFLGGGAYIAKCSLEAKNLIQTAIFGLCGVGIGIFLLISAIIGPPS